jgi:hypothetical protein
MIFQKLYEYGFQGGKDVTGIFLIVMLCKFIMGNNFWRNMLHPSAGLKRCIMKWMVHKGLAEWPAKQEHGTTEESWFRRRKKIPFMRIEWKVEARGNPTLVRNFLLFF